MRRWLHGIGGGKNPVGERLQVKGRWMRVVGYGKRFEVRSVRELPQTLFLCASASEFLSGRAALNIRTCCHRAQWRLR